MCVASIEVAEHAGVCYGVERALKLAHGASEQSKEPVCTLGPLIHNPLVVHELEKRGVSSVDDLEHVTAGTVIIRAHGVVPEVIDRARASGLTVLDATCPYVKKVHHAAERLVREGYSLLVVGESGHPEVEGIMGHAGAGAHVVSSPRDLDSLELGRKVGVVVQTTQTADALSSIVAALVPRVSEVRVINTICSATQERQDSAAELAARSDAMIIIGGKNSGNTRRLAEICSARCENTHHVEDASEIKPTWLDGVERIGVTAGASTPAAHIDRTVAVLKQMVGA